MSLTEKLDKLRSLRKTGTTLTQRVTSGVAWSGVLQASKQLLSLVSVAVLARKVPPSAYGLVAMASVLCNFLDTFRDLGTTSALIRAPRLSDELVNTVFWFNCAFGLLLSACAVGLSFPAAVFFREPELARVIQALSAVFILSALGVVPTAMLNRQMLFRDLSFAQLAGAAAGTGAAILAALRGFGVWSLVLGTVTNSGVTTAIFWILSPVNLHGAVNWKEAKSIVNYSLNLSGFNIINYFSRNADNLVVGRFLGSKPLGFYQMAYSVMLYPLNNFSAMVAQVLFPAMSQIQEDNTRFRRAFVRACMLTGMFTFPAMLGLTVVAVPFVRVLMGANWLPVSGLLVIFAPLGMLQSVYTMTGLIYNAKGRTDWLFRWGAFSGMFYVASFILGLRWGIQGVAICYALTWTALMFPGFAIPFRLIDLSGLEFVKSLWPPLKASLVMAAVAGGWLQGLRWMGVEHAPTQLFSTAVVGATCYVSLLLWWKPAALGALREMLEQSGNPMAERIARRLPQAVQEPCRDQD